MKPLSGCLALALATGLGGHTDAVEGSGLRRPWSPQWLEAQAALPRITLHDPHVDAATKELRWFAQPNPVGMVVVENCNDSGPGSLRAAMADAINGGEISVGQLGCSTITLTSGELSTMAGYLDISGPGPSALTISGNHASRVFTQVGAGRLALFDLSVKDGVVVTGASDAARGGCIYSSSYVLLFFVAVSGCKAEATGDGEALGGAIYAAQTLRTLYSQISDSTAHSGSGRALGGGVYATGPVDLEYTSFLRNTATTVAGNGGYGGGVASGTSPVSVIRSTFARNVASGAGGGIDATGALHMTNSTLYGNAAYRIGGAGLHIGGSASILASTISGNIESNPDGIAYGAGLSVDDGIHVTLQSSIVSGNVSPLGDPPVTTASDIGARGTSPIAISGADNLIGHSSLPLPDDTIISDDPQLGPLRNNGGPTETMMPLATSLVINVGNDDSATRYDQRGLGHPRIVGGYPDIGAAESDLDQAERIFADGFD